MILFVLFLEIYTPPFLTKRAAYNPCMHNCPEYGLRHAGAK